jgi:hypothetical protein
MSMFDAPVRGDAEMVAPHGGKRQIGCLARCVEYPRAFGAWLFERRGKIARDKLRTGLGGWRDTIAGGGPPAVMRDAHPARVFRAGST